MLNVFRHYRIGYMLLALALLGVGIVYLWNAESAQASQLSLTIECVSCHAEVPVVITAPSADPCDACHDDVPPPQRVVSPEQVGRELVALENHFIGFWENPLQQRDTRYREALGQLWQAEAQLMTAHTQSDFIAVENLIAQAEAALTQMDNEAQWGYWRALDSLELPKIAAVSDAPSPIPLVAHMFWDSLSFLKLPSAQGQHLELAGLLVLSLCLLMVALRRAPPDDACNVFDNLNLQIQTESRQYLTLSVFVCGFLSKVAQHLYRFEILEEVLQQEYRITTQYTLLI